MIKAIYACEDRGAALEKTEAVSQKLDQMKLPRAADKIRDMIQEDINLL